MLLVGSRPGGSALTSGPEVTAEEFNWLRDPLRERSLSGASRQALTPRRPSEGGALRRAGSGTEAVTQRLRFTFVSSRCHCALVHLRCPMFVLPFRRLGGDVDAGHASRFERATMGSVARACTHHVAYRFRFTTARTRRVYAQGISSMFLRLNWCRSFVHTQEHQQRYQTLDRPS